MATTTQLALPVRAASPLALWHLLSLDAPTVAALWTLFIARTADVRLPLIAPLAMALGVWILYAADRLLDARREHRSIRPANLEARHLFHHKHRRRFLAAICTATAALGAMLPLLDRAAIALYLIEGALLAVWFGVLHATRNADRLPKEIAVGLFFSAAVFIPTVAREPAQRPALAPAAVLFAVLCALNCLFIYRWEHTVEVRLHSATQPPHLTTRLALSRLHPLTLATIAAAILLTGLMPAAERLISAACVLSAALLLALDSRRDHLSRVHLRAAADAALLTPLLLMPLILLLR
ncbi:MAG TPA: hypothetical protein VG714_08265 [Acidobacteriaceae bacterium]|nr:hypothetical protein [Acidobacteriaceae bacterium]